MEILCVLGAFLLAARWASAMAGGNNSGSVFVTPHDSYSSSIGVLGCMINTNRVAYWPNSVDCTNICISLSYGDRQLYLLRIDQSGGAHDVSYDAWNYLYTGHSATDDPTAGGGIEMQFENVDADKCNHLIHTKKHKLPLSASNSMNYLASCLEDSDSWVAQHYVLYNIQDPLCSIGHDEVCDLDWPAANQATCPHILGDNSALTDEPVYNIRYPTGEKVLASSTGQAADDDDNPGWRPQLSVLTVCAAMAFPLVLW